MELGVTLMWHGQYVEAWEHFHSIIETDPRVGDGDYGMAGVAKWCLGEPKVAVSEWRDGLKAPYSRTPFGVYTGLLLFLLRSLSRKSLTKMRPGGCFEKG
jgi:hypothetical protein